MTETEERQLVEAARRGDLHSFGELYGRHYARMVGVAYAVLSDRHLAEDAAQEAFAAACRHLRGLRRPEKFGAWLRVLCRNVALRIGRTRTRSAELQDVAAPASDDSAEGAAEAVRQSIRRLPASEREVVILRYFSTQSYEQIAATLGISPRAVHGRLIRAKRRIAEDLKRNGLRGRIS